MVRNNIKLKLLISFFCVLSLIPIFIISLYSRPCSDDLSYSYPLFNMINSGNYNIFSLLLAALKVSYDNYFAWQGTYSSGVIMALQPGIFGAKYYFIGSILLITIMYVCLYKFISVVNKRFFSNQTSVWFVSLLFLTVFIQTVPDICQCLYWLCGAFHYVPFFSLDLVIAAYAVDYLYEENKRKKIINIVISSILSFIVSGGNQVTSFLNLMLLCLFVAYSFYRKKNKGIIITLFFAIIGFVIMFIAPGNAARLNSTTQTNVFLAIINSFKGAIKYACIWPSLSWLAFILIMIVYFTQIEHNIKIKIHPFYIVTLSLLIYAAMFCPYNYAMSTNGPYRLKNIIYFTLIVFSIIDVYYMLLWLEQKNVINIKISNKTSIILFTVLTIVMCFSLSNNYIKIIDELSSGLAESFANSYDERVEIMNNASNEIVEFKSLPDSKILKYDDITSNVNDWRNNDWYRYYGIKAIVNE